MKNIKIVNIDLGFKGYLSVIYHAIFSKHIQQPSRVQLVRIINFSRKGNEMGVFNSEFYELLISKRLQTPITIMLGPEGVKDLSLIVKQGLECRMERHNPKKGLQYSRDKF
jgi:hypothetical protein